MAWRGSRPTVWCAVTSPAWSEWGSTRGRPALNGLVIDGTPLISEEEQAKRVFGVAKPGVDWDAEGTHMVSFWKQASRQICA